MEEGLQAGRLRAIPGSYAEVKAQEVRARLVGGPSIPGRALVDFLAIRLGWARPRQGRREGPVPSSRGPGESRRPAGLGLLRECFCP